MCPTRTFLATLTLWCPFGAPSCPFRVPYVSFSRPFRVPFVSFSCPFRVPFAPRSCLFRVPFLARLFPFRIPFVSLSCPFRVLFRVPSVSLLCPFCVPSVFLSCPVRVPLVFLLASLPSLAVDVSGTVSRLLLQRGTPVGEAQVDREWKVLTSLFLSKWSEVTEESLANKVSDHHTENMRHCGADTIRGL